MLTYCKEEGNKQQTTTQYIKNGARLIYLLYKHAPKNHSRKSNNHTTATGSNLQMNTFLVHLVMEMHLINMNKTWAIQSQIYQEKLLH